MALVPDTEAATVLLAPIGEDCALERQATWKIDMSAHTNSTRNFRCRCQLPGMDNFIRNGLAAHDPEFSINNSAAKQAEMTQIRNVV